MPLPFEPRYDSSRIEPKRSYALRAAIRSAGRTLFATDTAYPVITQGHPTEVDLLLTRVTRGNRKSAEQPVGTAWHLEDLGVVGVLDRYQATLVSRGGKVRRQRLMQSLLRSRRDLRTENFVWFVGIATRMLARMPWGPRRGNTSRRSKGPSGSRSMGLRS